MLHFTHSKKRARRFQKKSTFMDFWWHFLTTNYFRQKCSRSLVVKCPRSKPRWRMLLRKLSSQFDSYNYCHKIIKVSFGKHNVGRCILSQNKGLGPKNFPGASPPDPFHLLRPKLFFPRHAAAKYSRNSPNRALQVSVSSKGPASTSCPGARPRSRRPWLSYWSFDHLFWN